MVNRILVLGGGSAGFIAALTLKRRLPHLNVRVIRSPGIGIIGVGEGTTPHFPAHFHQYLALPYDQFYSEAEPIWKLGIKYLWGPRASFNYSFARQTDWRWSDLPKSNGYYCHEEFGDVNLASALMSRNMAFARRDNGAPAITDGFAYHVENRKLVGYLEARAREAGVLISDATMISVQRTEHGVSSLLLDSGETVEADLFVDASGFASELLGKTLEEPFTSFNDALFCDRAVVGGWSRTTEVIEPYTTAETMEAGWCWRIDHEAIVNRGYVYSSDHLSDSQAEEEYRRKNPAVKEARVVRFRTGCFRRNWIGNVVAVGNASGFVEPLEATALLVICLQSRAIADGLQEGGCAPTPSMVAMYNRYLGVIWADIRNFLSIHYKFNTRSGSEFWKRCREETELHGAEPLVEYYRENGPSGLARAVLLDSNSPFGLEGYFTMLVGQRVPHGKTHCSSSSETAIWNRYRAQLQKSADAGVGVKEALEFIRDPRWRWPAIKRTS